MVLFTRGRFPEWQPCFYPQWLGASKLGEAVAQRKKFYADLPKGVWKPEQFKTIKVKLPLI